MGTFVPSRLKKAREQMGLTQEAFARSLGLSSEFISLLEAGKRAPSLATLSRIAAAAHRDASFFLSEKEHVFKVLFRAASLDDQVRAELDHFQGYVEDYLRLEAATGRRLEPAPLYAGNLSPERLAAEERRRLGLGEEPVRDIFALFERSGCRILRRRMPPEVRLSGVFVFLEAHSAAFALINASQTLCRQIYTAAHEYCHYLKDRHDIPVMDTHDIFAGTLPSEAGRDASQPDRPITDRKKSARSRATGRGPGFAAKEKFAQEFAARFLMPPAKVRELVEKEFGKGRLSYDDVLLVKRYFGVSAQAMLRTLRDLGLISAGQKEDFLRSDPVAREREVFGASAEECEVGGPASAADSDGTIVSDRYRLLKLKESAA
jgi:Zn-dependent peptidase ImmA (M78 family)